MGEGDLYDLFGTNRRVPITGASSLIVWNDPEKYRANDGLGMCNTGVDRTWVCVLGGCGCNVDHVQIARENLASYRQAVEAADAEKPGAADSR